MKTTPQVAKKKLLPSIFVLSGFAGVATITGCSGFWQAPGTVATPAVQFSTITQPYDDAINMNKLPFIPRPHQPLMGQMQMAEQGNVGTGSEFGSSFGEPYSVYTDKNGTLTEKGLEVNATWDLYYNWLPVGGCVSSNPMWNGQSAAMNEYLTDSSNPIPFTSLESDASYPTVTVAPFTCNLLVTELQTVTPQVVTSTPPATMSITYGADSSMNPVLPGPMTGYSPSLLTLYVYDQTGAQVATAPGQSVSSNGYTATFSFPQTSTGGSLPSGMYGTTIVANASSAAPINLGGEGYFFIGSIQSNYAQAFGVAARYYSQVVTVQIPITISVVEGPPGTPPTLIHVWEYQTDVINQGSYPVVTSLSNGMVYTGFGTVAVGQSPVAVVTYGTNDYSSSTTQSGGVIVEMDRRGTGYALVVNNGSNNITLVDLIAGTSLATIPVGNSPVAAVVDSANAYAYVANYADSTVSKVYLSTHANVATFAVGTNPTAIMLDAAGNLWVGGSGYVNQYNPQTYALTQSSSVQGVVNSLAISSGQNKVLTSLVQPATGSNPHALAQVSSRLMGSTSATTAALGASADAYAVSTVAKLLPSPYLLGGGTVVSVKYGNNLSISATPTGYMIQDVYTGAVLLPATTPAPVRGIAVDQTYGIAYLTIPDTSSVITVPIIP